jgi:hypothetical protein
MAPLETIPEQTTSPADDAVFVARDGRRARRLRNAAVVVGVLAVLWVVGLGVGMLGFGSLPGIGLVKGAHAHLRPADVPAPSLPVAPTGIRSDSPVVDAKAVRRELAQANVTRRKASVAAAHRAAARRAARTPVVGAPARGAQAPVNPAQRSRGWSRKGYTAPRGQLRKAAPPPPPPATSRGLLAGTQKTTTGTPPALAPGQAKKTLEPPPPPPPPKKG